MRRKETVELLRLADNGEANVAVLGDAKEVVSTVKKEVAE